MKEYTSILVPTDFSDCAQNVMDYACDFAKRTSAALHLLYVVEPIDTFATVNGVEQSVYFDMIREVRESAKQKLGELEARLKADGYTVVSALKEGRPSDSIVEYADEHKVSLICISTHGRSGLNHLLLGSTTERVLRKSHCPVMVIRCSPDASK